MLQSNAYRLAAATKGAVGRAPNGGSTPPWDLMKRGPGEGKGYFNGSMGCGFESRPVAKRSR